MKIITFNVNGLRAAINKGCMDYFASSNADMICVQETKMQAGQAKIELSGYQLIMHSAEKKGYSGTAIFTKTQPLSVQMDFAGQEEHSHEGRVITAEYKDFFLVCAYTPNAQEGLARIEYRLQWEKSLRQHLKALDQVKPVILCGDLNVAAEEIDLKNPKPNRGKAGFSDEERAAFKQLLAEGFCDVFRSLYPDKTGAYSWWSYRFHARENNAGWRIDYFVVSNRLFSKVQDCIIRSDVFGSDHCPVELIF